MHDLNLKEKNIQQQGPCKKLQVPINRIRSNKTGKETARGPRETKRNEKIEYKRKQARQLQSKSKNKNNNHGKFEPNQFKIKEDSEDSRIIQSH